MIKLFIDNSCYGIVIFGGENPVPKHIEQCSRDRVVELLQFFNDLPVQIFTNDQNLLDEIFFFNPHLRYEATLTIRTSLDVNQELKRFLPQRASRNLLTLLTNKISLCCVGVLIGCLLLVPLSREYKGSIMKKSEVQVGLLSSIEETPTVRLNFYDLYAFLKLLNPSINVESIQLEDTRVKIIISSQEANLSIKEIKSLKSVTTSKRTEVKTKDGAVLYFYELEGIYDRL